MGCACLPLINAPRYGRAAPTPQPPGNFNKVTSTLYASGDLCSLFCCRGDTWGPLPGGQPLSNPYPTLVHPYTLQIPRQKTPLSPGKGIPIHFHQHLQRTSVQPHVSKRSVAVGQGGGTGMMGGGILPSPCLHSGGGVEAGWMAAGSAAHWGE